MMKKLMVCMLFFCFVIQSVVCANPKNRTEWEETGSVIWEVQTNKKLIALTFDDGPHPKYTNEILLLLDKYHAKATFFVVGQRARSYPELLQTMHQKGHEIANHTYTHPNMSQINPNRLQEEMKKTDEVIYTAVKIRPALFRPPGGNFNTRVVETAKANQHLVVMWSWTQDTKDWANPGTKKIVNKVCRNARPGNIVLFHDFGRDRTQTIQALDIILKRLSSEGYKFVTVSELLAEKELHVTNK